MQLLRGLFLQVILRINKTQYNKIFTFVHFNLQDTSNRWNAGMKLLE